MNNILFYIIFAFKFFRFSVIEEDAFGKYKAPSSKDLKELEEVKNRSIITTIRPADLNGLKTHICIVGEDDPEGNDFSTLLVSTPHGTKTSRLYHDKRNAAGLSEGDLCTAEFIVKGPYANLGTVCRKK